MSTINTACLWQGIEVKGEWPDEEIDELEAMGLTTVCVDDAGYVLVLESSTFTVDEDDGAVPLTQAGLYNYPVPVKKFKAACELLGIEYIVPRWLMGVNRY